MTTPSTTAVSRSLSSFHVQKSPSRVMYSNLNQPITYNQVITKSLEGMDPASGIFTAPKAGVYYIAWTGLGRGANTRVLLMLNGSIQHLHSTSFNIKIFFRKKILVDSLPKAKQTNAIIMNEIIELKIGDQVSAVLSSGILYNDYINFIVTFLFSDCNCNRCNAIARIA